MLPAVNLDDYQSFAADEIADVTAYRLLPYKLMPIDLAVAIRFQRTVSASV
jgi:hypothetical protein